MANNINLTYYENMYFCNGDEVSYELKNGTRIKIYPVLVKDYSLYHNCMDVLQILKNEINDINVLRMSYLQFLLEYAFIQDELLEDKDKHYYEYKLRTIISLCLREDYIGFQKDENNRWNIVICEEDNTIKNFINPRDFDDIAFLILNQNDAHYDNRYVSPDARAVFEDYYRIKYADIEEPSFEKKKAFVCSKIGKTFKELKEIPIREFDLMYRACRDSEIYIATKIIESSSKFDVKNPANHPLYTPETDPYEEAFSSTDTLKGKGLKGAENIGMGLE